jgi:hypothetical protein
VSTGLTPDLTQKTSFFEQFWAALDAKTLPLTTSVIEFNLVVKFDRVSTNR